MRTKLTLIIVLFLYVSCASYPKRPMDVAKKFTDNMAKGKISKAKKYASYRVAELIDGGSRLIDFVDDRNITIISQKVSDNSAYVKYKRSDGTTGEMYLIKRTNGKWVVSTGSSK